MTYVDLTQPIATGMPVFPGDPAVEVEPVATVEHDGYRVSSVQCGSHSGTHIDAPSHTEPDGPAIDAFPVDSFAFDARIVDVSGRDNREPIPPTDLPDSTELDMVVFRTGWDTFWGTDRYRDHPYLTPEAGRQCAEAGLSVGIDALNPDPTPSGNATDDELDGFPVHRALLGSGLFIVENLTNLDGLEAGTLYAFPLPIRDGDGAPVRTVFEPGEQ